ncbi:MAG: thiolase family protein [Pseudomonadota bacterium]
MDDAVIIACARSPMARAGRGSFALTRIDDVGAQVVAGLMARVPGLDPALIEDVLIGCAMPEGEQGLNVARNIALLAGLPFSSGAVTINRFCASSLEAISQAVRAIWCGDGDLFLAGGIESMTHVPMGGFNPSLNEKLMRDGAPAAYINMGLTAENVAQKYSIGREEQDKFALASHLKAVSARERGKFDAEIVPIEAVVAGGGTRRVTLDEGPRPDSSLEALAKLEPAFLKGGTVTAGNSSPLTDGAAALLIASKSLAKKLGLKPMAKIRSMAVAGCDPAFMGIAPVLAVPKALRRAKMKLKDIELIELNEAFAAQSLAVVKELSIDERRLNVHGGAIALGHPLGMSGARIMTTLLHAMIDRKASTGMATMCIGGGQGAATIIERV